METPNNITANNLLERFNRWLQESIMIKLLSIGFLLLILLIPAAWIQDLIYERQSRAASVVTEVSDKWSGAQTVSGPVLVVPFRKYEPANTDGQTRTVTEYAFFLPDQLEVTGAVQPEPLNRGIFDVVVYNSTLHLNATFPKPDFASLSIAADDVLWSDAYLALGITDLRGISDDPTFTSGVATLPTEPSNNVGFSVRKTIRHSDANVDPAERGVFSTGIIARTAWNSADDFSSELKVDLSLKGSRRLDFMPTGKSTKVDLDGVWRDPSFDGEFLPISREIGEDQFSATWKVLHFNRPFSQQWAGFDRELSGADFGVRLLVPVDQYLKSMRTAKYGALIILLTFVALFLVEITRKIRIHPFQYILIGAALTIYYTLLLSLSEHMGFNVAYVIASAATVVLITLYSRTFFTSVGLSLLFCALLIVFYAFIYLIILEQDFSLLIGSVGLFLIVGALMYFSRNISWYSQRPQQ